MDWMECYRRMLLIRMFEETVERLFLDGHISGTAHAAIGQEAIAVGVCAALKTQDRITSTHRGHGHLLARGGDPNRMMAELFGKTAGYSRGRGGSQMMADREIGFLGGNGITGGSLPLAVGVALASHLKKRNAVTVCFFGDGAANQGTFHEALNLAALWMLPVLFICENNGYAMSTPIADGLAGGRIASRATAYGMVGIEIDGNDLPAIRAEISRVADAARTGHGPALIECHTYRLSGHSRGDPRKYRSRDEEAAAWANEPLARFERFLRAEGMLRDDEVEPERVAVKQRITDAVAFAESAPAPDAMEISCAR